MTLRSKPKSGDHLRRERRGDRNIFPSLLSGGHLRKRRDSPSVCRTNSCLEYNVCLLVERLYSRRSG